MRARSITGTITLDNGETVEFSMSPEYGDQRWGNVREQLGHAVPICEAMYSGVTEAELWTWDTED